MDEQLRNLLRAMVAACRELLEADVWRQLEGTFGVRPRDGAFLPPSDFHPAGDAAYRARRADVLDAITHLQCSGNVPRVQAVEQFVRATAFTALNRLAALKLMEHPSRELIRESVGRGRESSGFRQFLRVCPSLTRAAHNNDVPDSGYRLYLECLCDDLATDLGVLFDRRLPQAIIFPSDACLRDVLARLNDDALQAAWGHDETIGWIYQYFTPGQERRDLRREAAPRNAYELACRNQFYTPRYVVEFLVDNTLGRIWYEMRRGDTALVDAAAEDRCRFLVHPPGEFFLGPGEAAPDPGPEPASPQERLTRPTPVPHRPKRDPRDLRVLDPACGSGHFLLYAYQLLTTVYREAWDDPESPPFADTGRTLRQDFANRDDFERRLPGLILRHNLFGIDIDLRSTQIAALALWLRAQRSLRERHVKVAERPPITRTNIVCAEPMPGEVEDLNEFVGRLQPRVLGQLVRAVFEQMAAAGEVGSLLKVEEQLRANITAARRTWLAGPRYEYAELFPEARRPTVRQGSLFDVSDVTDEQFWADAFHRVVDEVRRYAESAPVADAYRRRLFADDTARGFAFVDLCRHSFDVVLMNPPFGEASVGSREYIDHEYPRGKENILAAFVERGLQKLRPGGMLGAITSRTVFFLTYFRRWREEVVLGLAQPTVFADLGDRVLDAALVEAAAYCLEMPR